MSISTSTISSVVASPAPLVCEALHLSKYSSPGKQHEARGRFKNTMSGLRSDLRKLRNKVYVRIFSGQGVVKHLLTYQFLTESFIREYKTVLSVEEVDSFHRRLKVTKNAVAASVGKSPTKYTSSSSSCKLNDSSLYTSLKDSRWP